MKFNKTHLEFFLKPSEMKIIAEKYMEGARKQIEQFKEKKFIGEMGLPCCCEEENINASLTFLWKPEFDENGNVTNY